MVQFIKIESDEAGIAKVTYLPKYDLDGVHNWTHKIDYSGVNSGVRALRGQRHTPSKN